MQLNESEMVDCENEFWLVSQTWYLKKKNPNGRTVLNLTGTSDFSISTT